MRRTLALFSATLLLLTGIAGASQISLGSGSIIAFLSGAFLSYSAPAGTFQAFSVSFILPNNDASGLQAYYRQLLGAGATWQRLQVQWGTIQSTSSASYVWGTLDTQINEALADGITTVLDINNTPTWARYSGCSGGAGIECAPANGTVVGTFAAALAAHFDGRVKYYEIWNEPNRSASWSPSPTSTDYVSVLNASYSAIKAVDSGDVVIGGALAGAEADITGVQISAPTFVTSMYANNATFDILSIHPYSYPYSPNNFAVPATSNGWQQLDSVRDIMIANGDSAKKIWATEVGAPTCGPGSATGIDPASFTHGSDYLTLQAQAQMAADVIATSTSMSFLAKVFWYGLVDTNSLDSSTNENCFGVYYTNGIPKPAYAELRSN